MNWTPRAARVFKILLINVSLRLGLRCLQCGPAPSPPLADYECQAQTSAHLCLQGHAAHHDHDELRARHCSQPKPQTTDDQGIRAQGVFERFGGTELQLRGTAPLPSGFAMPRVLTFVRWTLPAKSSSAGLTSIQ